MKFFLRFFCGISTVLSTLGIVVLFQRHHQRNVVPVVGQLITETASDPISGGENAEVTQNSDFWRNMSTDKVNPGCIERKLAKYRAIDSGKVYHHPPLVHYAKLARGSKASSINFREFTSVLSVYKFLKPEKITFHTYGDITGRYWDEVNSWNKVHVELNKISPVRKIGGKPVRYIQHEADYIKLRALRQYGGLALDFDVVIINATRLHQKQRLSECVLSEEGEYVNGGFYSCIRNSSFVAKWLESYDQDYRPDLWLHNVSYRPTNLLIGGHFNGTCYNIHLDDTISINPNAGNRRYWLSNKVQWTMKTAAHYFVKTGIPNDGEGLLKQNHSLAHLLQYVHHM